MDDCYDKYWTFYIIAIHFVFPNFFQSIYFSYQKILFPFLYNLESAILVHEPGVLVALERVYDRYIDHDFIAQNKNVS